MRLITGLLILLLFQCGGEAIKAYFSLNVPGPVIGMALLFIGLCIRGAAPPGLLQASQALITLLSLMFLPAAAGIFFLSPTISNQWLAIFTAIIVGSVLSLVFNSLIIKWLTRNSEL